MGVLIVVISGFFHALWNILTKKSRNKSAFLLNVQTLSIIVFFPYVVTHTHLIHWSWISVIALLGTMSIHGIYFVLLARAYSVAEVSKVYPIIRGTSSLIVPLLGVALLNEHLTVMGWCGVAGIICGILLLDDTLWTSRFKSWLGPHTILGLLIGGCVASYILIDKWATQFFPIITLNWFGTLGNILILLLFIKRKSAIKREWKKNTGWIICGAFLAPVSYMMFLWAIQTYQVAQLAPIREIGTVFGVFLGVIFLKEKRGPHRLFASSLITAGILLLAWNC